MDPHAIRCAEKLRYGRGPHTSRGRPPGPGSFGSSFSPIGQSASASYPGASLRDVTAGCKQAAYD
jgi:hypothetical protein